MTLYVLKSFATSPRLPPAKLVRYVFGVTCFPVCPCILLFFGAVVAIALVLVFPFRRVFYLSLFLATGHDCIHVQWHQLRSIGACNNQWFATCSTAALEYCPTSCSNTEGSSCHTATSKEIAGFCTFYKRSIDRVAGPGFAYCN